VETGGGSRVEGESRDRSRCICGENERGGGERDKSPRRVVEKKEDAEKR